MSKISTIISREYNTRVRKKSFLIMSIVGPILFAGLMVMPTIMMKMGDTEEKLIAVVDSSHLFHQSFPETKYLKFEYMADANIDKYKTNFYDNPYYAVLFINSTVVNNSGAVVLYSDKSPSMGMRMHISNVIEKKLEKEKLKSYKVDENILEAVKTNISIRSVKLTKDGEENENNFTLNSIIGYLVGLLIYFTIFFSGSQVMRGVIEEKTNRIVEIIVSSVKPFQLMMGKIIGVGLVSLTQFALWIVLTIALYSTITPLLMPDVSNMSSEVQVQNILDSQSTLQDKQMIPDEMNSKVQDIMGSIPDINFGVIIFSFLFFFFGGYFLYGALFAAIASAVDSETDTQQFMLPITIPLMIGILVMINAVQNPESALAYWFSIIPFTSPIVMMARIPFGVPWFQIVLSGLLLIITFILTTWLSGKIYRTGILMYGKKTNWKEIWKWIKYKN